jgi:hypothetical protein
MSKSFSRRRFLRSALAASVLPILPDAVRGAPPAPKRLVAGSRMLEVNGRSAKVFGPTGPDGRPGIRLAAGERFRVELATNPAHAPLSTGMGSFHPGRRMAFPGRRPRRSQTALFNLMTMRPFQAPTGCTRITTCRSRG